MNRTDKDLEIWNYVHSWNYKLGESWEGYIQRLALAKDIGEAQRNSTSAIVKAISAQTGAILTGADFSPVKTFVTDFDSSVQKISERISSSFESSTRALSDVMQRNHAELAQQLDGGFNMLDGHLDAISSEISGLNGTLESGFGQILGSLNGMSDSLESLIEIAKVPTQTAAYEYFEIARDAFRKELYAECLQYLFKAIKGVPNISSGHELEWRFHRLVGVVRLGFVGCDPSLIDLPEAEKGFLFAAKYAKKDAPKEAAVSMLQAGLSAYAQQNMVNALAYTEQAIVLAPNWGKARFQAAKFLMGNKQPELALQRLRQAVDINPIYVVKASADIDFKPFERKLKIFLLSLRTEKSRVLTALTKTSLEEAEGWTEAVPEIKACEAIFGRWRSVLKGDLGLINLLKYERVIGKDQKEVQDVYARGIARIAKEKADRERAERERQEKAEKERLELEKKLEKEKQEQASKAEKERLAREEKEVKKRLKRKKEAEDARQAQKEGAASLLAVVAILGLVFGAVYLLVTVLGVLGWLIVIVFGVAILCDTVF